MNNMKTLFILLLAANIAFYPAPFTAAAQDAGDLQNAKLTELVTLNYKEVELAAVLRSLAATYELNLVTAEAIKGKVTINLSGVSLEEALNTMLKVNGYALHKDKNVFYILPGPTTQDIGLETVSVDLKYLNGAEAEALLKKLLSGKGEIRVNEATNSLVITDYSQMVRNVKDLISTIDVKPVQVLIEAKIIDITQQDLRNIGVTYSAGQTERYGIIKSLTSAAIDVAGPSSLLTGGQMVLDSLNISYFNVDATIDALIRDQKAHLLASPSIATLNGKEARIVIGEKFPYKEQTQTTTGTTETTKFVEIGITLKVTPQVGPNGEITMKVHPEVSSVTDADLEAGPRISTREADATIRVKDGQTIVIGGLIETEKNMTRDKIPILGDLPIIGAVFSSKSNDDTQNELAVFITPRIIQDAEDLPAGTTKQREAYVTMEGRSEDMFVSNLWESAVELERDHGIEARRKDKEAKMLEALDQYEQIVLHFPKNPKADEALYRIGRINSDYFDDQDAARAAFSQLVENYPESVYASKAKRVVEKIDNEKARLEEREARQRARIAEQEKKKAELEKARKKSKLEREKRKAELEKAKQKAKRKKK